MLVWFARHDAIGCGDVKGIGYAADREYENEFGHLSKSSPFVRKII